LILKQSFQNSFEIKRLPKCHERTTCVFGVFLTLGLFSLIALAQEADRPSVSTPRPESSVRESQNINRDVAPAAVPENGHADSRAQFRTEIPYGENTLILLSDQRERGGDALYRVTGNVVITFLDMIITCNEAEYDEDTLRVSTLAETWFRQKRASLTASGALFDPGTQTVILHDASGYFYDTRGRSEREFFLTGGTVQHIKTNKLQIHWGAESSDSRHLP